MVETASASVGQDVDEFGPGGYDPRLYEHHGVAQGIDGVEAFTEAQVDRYRQDGFLVVENVLSDSDVRAALAGLLDLIAGKHLSLIHI